MYFSEFPNVSPDPIDDLLIRAEPYLVFSIISFTSVGSALNNSKGIDTPLICIIGANIFMGIMTFYMFSNLTGRVPSDEASAAMIVEIGVRRHIKLDVRAD
jgi:hypothetical protein